MQVGLPGPEHCLDESLVAVYGIEQSLDIDLALNAFRIGIDLDEAARQLLAVEGLRMDGIAVVEVEFL